MRLEALTFFLFLGLLPFVPSVSDPISLIFASSFIGLSIATAVRRSWLLQVDQATMYVLAFLFIFLPLNIIVGLAHGLQVSDISRAIVPFLFIFFYIVCLNMRVSSPQIVRYLVFASLVWAFSIVLMNFSDFVSVLSGNIGRLTYSVPSMLIPFGLVGFTLLLYSPAFLGKLRIPAIFLFALLILASGYRSQLVLAVLMVVYRYRNILSARSALAILVAIFSGLVFLYLNPQYIQMIIFRFQYSAGDTVRSAEIEFAMEVFRENLFLGTGLGSPVPVAITRPEGVWDQFQSDSVSYIHNFFGYVFMDTGFLGFAFFSVLLVPPIVRYLVTSARGRSECEEACFVLLLNLIVYFQISASFRQVQMWIVISCLLVVLNRMAGRGRGSISA